MDKKRKFEVVYDYLRIHIDENKFSSSTKLPSEPFLSNRLSVCRETVRKAIKELEKEGLVYSVQGGGTFFNRQKALESNVYQEDFSGNRIALIIQGKDRGANSSFILAVKDELGVAGIGINIFYTDNKLSNERKCLLACKKGFKGIIVDGVKSSMLNPNIDVYSSLFSRGIPIVFYNNYYSETKYPRILNDDFGCADLLMRILYEKGHKHVAGIFLSDNSQAMMKYLGYTKALLKYSMVFDDDYVRFFNSPDLEDMEWLKKMMWVFLKSNPKCTAVVCCNIMLYKVLKSCLHDHGMKIPDDYSVICFDYSNEDFITEGVTCSVHQGYKLGISAAKQILAMINDKDYCSKDYSCTIAPVIYEGKSVKEIVD